MAFCILAGSKAAGEVADAFKSKVGYDRRRKNLIDSGKLSRTHKWEDFTFTEDVEFPAPSPAASIVDGHSRSGDVWGKKSAKGI